MERLERDTVRCLILKAIFIPRVGSFQMLGREKTGSEKYKFRREFDEE